MLWPYALTGRVISFRQRQDSISAINLMDVSSKLSHVRQKHQVLSSESCFPLELAPSILLSTLLPSSSAILTTFILLSQTLPTCDSLFATPISA